MDAKAYLKSISRKESFINAKKLRLQALKDLAYHIPSPNFSKEMKVKKNTNSPVADAIIKAADLEKEIQKEEIELYQMKAYMIGLIGEIHDPDEESVLIKRYFEHMSWVKIAAELYYSTRWIYVLHGRALDKLNRMQL